MKIAATSFNILRSVFLLIVFFSIVFPSELVAQKTDEGYFIGTPVQVLHAKSATDLNQFFTDYQVFELDTRIMKQWVESKKGQIAFNFSLGQKLNWHFSGHQTDVRGAGFEILRGGKNGLKKSVENLPLTLEGQIGRSQNNTALFTINDSFLAASFRVEGQNYYIERVGKFSKGADANQYVLYTAEQVIQPEDAHCGTLSEGKSTPLSEVPEKMNEETTLPNLCMEFLAVADSSFYEFHGSNTVNEVVTIKLAFNSLYLNDNIGIHFQLTGIIIFDQGDPYSYSFNNNEVDSQDLLNKFRVWRTNNLGSLPPNAISHLFSRLDFYGSTIGLAYVGPACKANDDYTVGINQLTLPLASNATLLAHEVGHNLGAEHDNDPFEEYFCIDDSYIMTGGLSSPPPTQFSDCSKTYFINQFNDVGTACTGCQTLPCESAISLDCQDAVTDATFDLEPGSIIPSCGDFVDAGAPGRWYTFTGTGTTLNFSTCHPNTNFDTQIAVFEGDCSNLTCLAANNDTSCENGDSLSTVTINTVQGTTYYIYVTGASPASTGTFTLTIYNPNLEDLRLYVNAASPPGGDGLSWASAYQDFQEALSDANNKLDCNYRYESVEIWVAEGTYSPTLDQSGQIPVDPREATFYTDKDIKIYGGFPNAGSPTMADRDWESHITTLSGDLGNLGDHTDNAYTVVHTEYITTEFLMDGFHIAYGNASVDQEVISPLEYGGGWYSYPESAPTIKNCSFHHNRGIRGAGMYQGSQGKDQSMTFSNCQFYENTSIDGGIGGALYLLPDGFANQTTSFVDCTFSNNQAPSGGAVFIFAQATNNITFKKCLFSNNQSSNSGGALFINNQGYSTRPKFEECVFSDNHAQMRGGGMYLATNVTAPTSMEVTNCLFTGNSAEEIGGVACFSDTYGATTKFTNSSFFNNSAPTGGVTGVYLWYQDANPVFTNCVLWGNSSTFDDNPSAPKSMNIEYSLIQEGDCPATANCGDGMIYGQDPLYVDPANGDLHLSENSPAINAGTNMEIPPFDFDGNPRPFPGTDADMGAFEFTPGPTAICQDLTVTLEDGVYYLDATQLNDGSTGAPPLSYSIGGEMTLTLSCNNVGTNPITLTVTDANDLSNTCISNVTVEDNTPPALVCKDITVQLDENGDADIIPTQVLQTFSDECGVANMTLDNDTFSCADVGTSQVEITITDIHDNTNSCTANVTVEDMMAPEALCQDLTLQLDANGQASTTAAAVDDGSDDACGIDGLELDITDFDCGNTGSNTVILTTTDVNGNSNTCSATITIEDPIAPSAVCQDATVQLDGNGNGNLTYAMVDNGSSDACGIDQITVSPNAFTCANIGTNLVTLTVVDVNGNSNSCTANVTVEDSVAPTAKCQDLTLKLNASGMAATSVEFINDGSTDACGIADLEIDQNTFGCADVGSNPITLTVTDVNGNSSTCTATVTVQDDIAPTAVCLNNTVFIQPEGTYTLLDTDVLDFGASSDNCGAIEVSQIDPAVADCDDVGNTVPVLVTVSDDSGNATNCTAQIAVEKDTRLPDEWSHDDVGAAAGDAIFDPCVQAYSVDSYGGSNFASDVRHMVYQEICGNAEIVVHVSGITNPGWAGVEIRESLASNAKMTSLKTSLGNFVVRTIRSTTGGYAQMGQFFAPGSSWLKLTRTGSLIMGYSSFDGVNWNMVLLANVPFNSCAYVGFFAESSNSNATTALFDEVYMIGNNNGSSLQQLPTSNPVVNHAEPAMDVALDAYPNPFPDQVNIRFYLPSEGDANLEIFNLQGQRIHAQDLGRMQAGWHEQNWDGQDSHYRATESGIYLIRLTTPQGAKTIRVNKVK